MDFSQFLSGMPAKDYIFQHIPYEEQTATAAQMIKNADVMPGFILFPQRK